MSDELDLNEPPVPMQSSSGERAKYTKAQAATAISELEEARAALDAARGFAAVVFNKEHDWKESEAAIRRIHEECHWHLEHEFGVIL